MVERTKDRCRKFVAQTEGEKPEVQGVAGEVAPKLDSLGLEI